MEFRQLEASRINRFVLGDIFELLNQLSDKAKWLSRECLKKIISNPEMVLIVAYDGEAIVGMASIYFRTTMMRKIGTIEDVAVLPKYRGKGIGRKLTEILIEESRKRKTNHAELTSNPKRKIAIAMYESMGFVKRETNCYRLNLFA